MVPSSSRTVGPRQGHAGPTNADRTNSYWFDAFRDIQSSHQFTKPKGITTVGVKVNFSLSGAIAAGEWIAATLILAVRELKGGPLGFITGTDFVLGNDSGTPENWKQVTFKFKGFPTQEKVVEVFVIRRASTPGGDFGSTVSTRQLHIARVRPVLEGFSDAPPSGYGYNYAGGYGMEL